LNLNRARQGEGSPLDTNIIVDALAARIPFDQAAKKILLLFGARRYNCAITASTASDLYYIVGKYLKDEGATREKLKALFSILDIVSVDKADCLSAFNTGMQDYEDSLLALCASKYGADCIVTRNIADFTGSPVKAITPDDFLAKMAGEQ
jgi:predicted nucleic acid-binding protein